MKSYPRKTCLHVAFFQCYFYAFDSIVTVGVGSGKQSVMLQGFIISSWEKCPFATMASLVFHASSSQFQALQHTACRGQVLQRAQQKAASAGQVYSTLREWVHIRTKSSALSCSTGSQILFSSTGEGVFRQVPL